MSLTMQARVADASKQPDDAHKAWQEAVALEPTADTLAQAARAAWKVGQYATAREQMHRAITLDDTNAANWYALGSWLRASGQEQPALDCLLKSLSLEPYHAEALVETGLIYFERKEWDLALACNLKAANLKAVAHPAVAWNNAQIHLAQGDLPGAWDLYESRFAAGVTKVPPFTRTLPRWGGEDCTHLLLYGEQGIGDQVMMLRYVPAVLQRADRATLFVRDELVTFVEARGYRASAYSDMPPVAQCWFPMGSLPWLYRTTRRTIPTEGYELNPWRLIDQGRVGVCWEGSPMHPRNAARNMSREQFAGLHAACPDAEFLSLTHSDPTRVAYADVLELSRWIESCEAVVTVDTAVAHLAGTLGVPCIVLIPWLPDWRWGLSGDCTEWYPTLRLVRQQQRGAWTDEIQQAGVILRSILNGGEW